MANQKVLVKNLTNGRVGIDIPTLNFRRIWEKKGAVKPVDFDVLQEIIYDPGVEYMFKEGILYIDDMATKIKLGLEPEDTTEPVNIIVLTDTQKKRYLTVAPIFELKELLTKMSYEQIQDLAQFAIENELIDIDRCDLIKEAIQVDIIKAVQFNRENKEE